MNNTNVTTEERRRDRYYPDRPYRYKEGDWENWPMWARVIIVLFVLFIVAFLVWTCCENNIKKCCNGAPPPPPAVFPPEIDPNVINDVENQAPNNEPPAPAWIATAVEQTQTKSVKSQQKDKANPKQRNEL